MKIVKGTLIGLGIAFCVFIVGAVGVSHFTPRPNPHQITVNGNLPTAIQELKTPAAGGQLETNKTAIEIPETQNVITAPAASSKIAELAEVKHQQNPNIVIKIPVEIPDDDFNFKITSITSVGGGPTETEIINEIPEIKYDEPITDIEASRDAQKKLTPEIPMIKNEEVPLFVTWSSQEEKLNPKPTETKTTQVVEIIIVREFKKPDYIKKLSVQLNRTEKNISGIKRCLSRIVGHRVTDIKLKLRGDDPKVIVKNFGKPCFNMVLALNSLKGEIKFAIDGPIALGRYNWGKNGKSWRFKNADLAELNQTNLAEAKKFISQADKTFYQYPPEAADIDLNNLNNTTNAATLVCSKSKG